MKKNILITFLILIIAVFSFNSFSVKKVNAGVLGHFETANSKGVWVSDTEPTLTELPNENDYCFYSNENGFVGMYINREGSIYYVVFNLI